MAHWFEYINKEVGCIIEVFKEVRRLATPSSTDLIFRRIRTSRQNNCDCRLYCRCIPILFADASTDQTRENNELNYQTHHSKKF